MHYEWTSEEIITVLENWRGDLCQSISLAGLIARSPIAHKWKVTKRLLVLRETVFWRFHDLLSQSMMLHEAKSTLGARILARSALETLAILIFLGQLIEGVIAGSIAFAKLNSDSMRLLMGSKNKSTREEAINFLTVLAKCEIRYPNISAIYADLCEAAHPNYEGLCGGYSTVDETNMTTHFYNKWYERDGEAHLHLVQTLMSTFDHEYNDVSLDRYEQLEKWLIENDEVLERWKADELKRLAQ
jgi:hypothetical protein